MPNRPLPKCRKREVSVLSILGVLLALALILGGLIAFILARPTIICPQGWLPVLGQDASFCARDGETGYIPEKAK